MSDQEYSLPQNVLSQAAEQISIMKRKETHQTICLQ